MQAYRGTSSPVPVLTFVSGRVLALDPENGSLRWERRVDRTVSRVLVVGTNVFVATRTQENTGIIFVLDIATGKEKGTRPTDFVIESALAIGDRLYFAGRRGFVALSSDGALLFRVHAKVMRESAWDGDTYDLVGIGPTGAEQWRIPEVAWGQNAWIALGEQVAQADFEG